MANKPKPVDPSPLESLSEPDTLQRVSPPSLPAAPPVVQIAETAPETEVIVVGKATIPDFSNQPEDPPEPPAQEQVIPGVEAKAGRVPFVAPEKLDRNAPPPVLEPGSGGDVLEPDGTVLFISKVPGFQVRLGVDVKDLHTFSGNNELRVKPDIAKRLKMHHLYEMGHFYLASEVLRSGDKYLVIKRDDPMAEERAAGKVLFYFPEKPTLNVMLPGVKQANGGSQTEYVQFSDHRAAVDPAVAEVLKRHTFFREGRIRELV